MKRAVSLATADTIFFFGLVVFIYIATIGIIHPEWLTGPITHHDWLPGMRIDNIAILAFLASIIGFFAGRYLRSI